MNFFLSNSRLVILITVGLVFMGIKGLMNLQRQTIPPVDFARAIITTIYPGSSPKEVEELITRKIEEEIRSVDHLKDVNSISKPGMSQIHIRIDIDKGNTTEVINELHQSLQNIQGLPREVLDPPKLIHADSSSERSIMNLLMAGPDKERLRDKISWGLKTNLERNSGVSSIEMHNYKKREFLVLISPEKMEKYHISSMDIISALEQKKMDMPSGHLENNVKRTLVRVISDMKTIEGIENIVVRSNFSGNKIFIKDVARVMDSYEKETQREYYYQYNKEREYNLTPVTSLNIKKTQQADVITVASAVHKMIKKFKKNLVKGYKLFIGFDEGENTKRRLQNVVNNALIGFLIIFIVFFLFLPSRIGFMASWSLPLSLLGTFAFLPFMGVSFDVMTMLAFVICIGMLVDNSVVISEYYSRLVMDKEEQPKKAAWKSVRQFTKPITATVLTTIVAFLPLLVTTGVMGQFVRWIPIVVTLALLMSLFESFFLLPSRLQWFHQKKIGFYQRKLISLFNNLEFLFEKIIRKVVARKYMSLSFIGLIIIITGVLFVYGSRVDLFAPKSPEFYTALIEPPYNTSLSVIDKKAKEIAHKMYSVFGGSEVVQWISVKTGLEKAEILLRVRPSVLRKLEYKNIINKLRTTEKGNLRTLRFSVMAGGPPVGKPLSVAIQSQNRKEINKFIDEVFPEIKKVGGLVDLKSNPEKNMGVEYKVQVDMEMLARLGLQFLSVGTALRAALEGHIITELTENNESFYVRVKHEENQTSTFEDLKKIKIKENMGGRLIPLSEVTQIKEVPSEPNRRSFNFEPVIFLEADIDPKKITSMEVNSKVQKIIEQKIIKYPSLTFKMVGEQETTQESLRSLSNAALIAIFAIFIILITLFKSFLLSFLILTCIPLGLIGVIWAFFLHQRSLDFFAMVGVIALAGVVVNSAIILVSFILQLKEENHKRPLSEVVIEASRIRFRPIIITNLTTLGGLFPTAYAIMGFEPLLIPMTLALFWGLFTATLLTLIWIPCSVLVIEDLKKIFVSIKDK